MGKKSQTPPMCLEIALTRAVDRYGRVFHPQILLHQVIASLVIYEMANKNEVDNGYPTIPETFTFDSCPFNPPGGSSAGDSRMYHRGSYRRIGQD